MLDLLRSVWIWTASAMLVLAGTPVIALIRVFDRNPLRLRTARNFRLLGRVLAQVYPCRIQITGLQNLIPDQVYVIVSNHQSLADIPLVAHLRIDTKWIAKAELFRVPFVGWLMRMSGDIPVDRSNPRKAAQALLQCARYLRRRCSVVFFPEGTRSLDGRLQAFNDGPFRLAIREQAPVLPVVLDGSGVALPRGSWIFNGAPEIRLRILEPVPVTGWDIKQSAELRETVRQRMMNELSRLRGLGSDEIDPGGRRPGLHAHHLAD